MKLITAHFIKFSISYVMLFRLPTQWFSKSNFAAFQAFISFLYVLPTLFIPYHRMVFGRELMLQPNVLNDQPPDCCLGCQNMMIYQTCGGCVRTCRQRDVFCPAVCRQGCACPSNYFLHNGRCVAASQCPPV